MRGKPSAIREAAIFGAILTIRSNMLQNEAVAVILRASIAPSALLHCGIFAIPNQKNWVSLSS
jgi:hypothetical protein